MSKEYQLGVLFVHGIGQKRRGETLTEWGDILVKTLQKSTLGQANFSVNPIRKSDNDLDEIELIKSDEKWLLSEGYWGDAFLAPTFGELVSWSVRALPFTIMISVAENYWNIDKNENRWYLLLYLHVWTYLKILAMILIAPLLVAVLWLTGIVGILPIAQLRSTILAIQSTLVNHVGDSLAYVGSPVRAALIKDRVRHRLRSLIERCDKTVILAHSQGAAISLDVLEAYDNPRAAKDVPNVLITFGAGTNKLGTLKMLTNPNSRLQNASWHLISIGLGFVSLLLWFYIHSAWKGLLISSGLATVGLFIWAICKIFTDMWAEKLWPDILPEERPKPRGLYFIVVLLIGLYAWITFELQVIETAFLSGILLFLIHKGLVQLDGLFSKQLKSLCSALETPKGLERWVDIYALGDPVPNGPTRYSENCAAPESIPICNLNSFISDHTYYWRNLDGFVLRIIYVMGETANSPWLDRLPSKEGVDDRAEWRTYWLHYSNLIIAGCCCFMAYDFWGDYNSMSSIMPFNFPDWLPSPLISVAYIGQGVIGLVCIIWLLCGVLRTMWRLWTFGEQHAVLLSIPRNLYERWNVTAICSFVLSIVVSTFLVHYNKLQVLISFGVGVILAGLLCYLLLMYGVIYLFFKIRPSPGWPIGNPVKHYSKNHFVKTLE